MIPFEGRRDRPAPKEKHEALNSSDNLGLRGAHLRRPKGLVTGDEEEGGGGTAGGLKEGRRWKLEKKRKGEPRGPPLDSASDDRAGGGSEIFQSYFFCFLSGFQSYLETCFRIGPGWAHSDVRIRITLGLFVQGLGPTEIQIFGSRNLACIIH